MRCPARILCGAGLAGCSFLYNPNNLPNPAGEAGTDELPDAAIVLDADPSRLELVDIVPNVIDEGQGDGGSAPALLVIRGHQIVNANLSVTLVPPAGKIVRLAPISDAVASHDGNYVAFTVTAHVDRALVGDVPLDVVVSEDVPAQYGGGTTTKTLAGTLTLHGLPELTSSTGGVVDKPGKQVHTPISDRYSMVDLSDVSPATVTGPALAELRAVSSINLGAIVASASGTVPGPSGQPGTMSAGQGTGGGGRGGDATLSGLLATGGGGGGGGAATTGGPGATGTSVLLGAGGAGGGAGAMTGDDGVVSYLANRASAGGAGGTGGTLGLLAAGGAGGAGGGMVALIAGGNITAGAISVTGGDGTSSMDLGGGGGGGGAGGCVVVRSARGTLAVGTINVKGGAAGGPGGGTGSPGRVRWDAPVGAPPSSPDRPAHRGPAFTVQTRIFTVQRPALTLAGTFNDGFSFRVTDHDNNVHDGGHASFNSTGVATIQPRLEAGHNQVCVTLDGGMAGRPEADACIDVAFLP